MGILKHSKKCHALDIKDSSPLMKLGKLAWVMSKASFIRRRRVLYIRPNTEINI